MNFILWDVDGTLVYNGADAGNLYHDALEIVVGRPLGDRLPGTHGKTDGQIITENLSHFDLDPALHPLVVDQLDELSRLRHDAGNHRELCPGVASALAAVSAGGWTSGLLTGNSAARARYKVTGAGLSADLFDWEHSYFGERDPLRTDLTRRARAELPDARIVIIGDTPNDGLAADAAGMEFLAVGTGAFSLDDLRATSARVVVADLATGLPGILEALGDGTR
ncbi:HAD family hydrolase [Glaciihabitans arcticus]|uniref:HAD family hydrolase n=1 Tax=Glaciihabitans arcticus TaxID=2668039 RepID=A0A4Q9GQ49_9MICO|nr:HAD family hydrolase [Glaciihabitans arcticus]TBN56966.1 HAD family hydrolase [Glaciihabitans arcticus]